MQLEIINIGCGCVDQLAVRQPQGDNTPFSISIPYNVTGVTFEGTINFPSPALLSLGSGLTLGTITSYTASISGNILNVTAIASGTIAVGMLVAAPNIAPNTYITSLGTGTGGIGTYNINIGQNVASGTIALSQVILQLLASQTQDVAEGQYPFDLWTVVTGSPPTNTPIISGFFEINNAITRIS